MKPQLPQLRLDKLPSPVPCKSQAAPPNCLPRRIKISSPRRQNPVRFRLRNIDDPGHLKLALCEGIINISGRPHLQVFVHVNPEACHMHVLNFARENVLDAVYVHSIRSLQHAKDLSTCSSTSVLSPVVEPVPPSHSLLPQSLVAALC